MEAKRTYRDFFDKEAGRYDRTRNFYEKGYGGARERKMLSLFCRGPIVLNAACGTGRLLSFLDSEGFMVIGIDLSRQMLNVARTKTALCVNVHLIRCDAECLPFRSESFNEVVCSRAFKLFPRPKDALSEWLRVLKQRGKSIISLETSDPLWIKVGYWLKIGRMGSRFEWRYRSKKVKAMFEQAGFRILFTGCVFYFGRTIYEILQKHAAFALAALELIDSHSRNGRNVMLVALKS